ncbi:MAG: arginase family protein [Chloroflexi bacterium]|nr:arginase family protein [Chloroflexota bacterium]
MNIAIVTLPWQLGSREVGHGRGTEAILGAGLAAQLQAKGHQVGDATRAELSADEARLYGAWLKAGLANGHLADGIATQRKAGQFVVALESDCTGAVGALGGIRRSGVKRIGMIWIDAHADFNTTETSLSGMLGGMPVAIAAGLCLERLRKQSGLDEPIRPSDVIMVGLRDVDPLEMDLLKAHGVEMVDADPDAVRSTVARLSQRVDAIYVHTDWDVLDPKYIPTAGLPVPNGPSLTDLARIVSVAAADPKAVMVGFAAFNADRDPDGTVARNLASVVSDSL